MPASHGLQPQIAVVAPEDAGELLTLQRAAYASEAQIHHDPYLPALTQSMDELRAELGRVSALKATVGHHMVGAVRAHLDASVLHVARLIVAPDWQGRGVASPLLAAIEAHHADSAESATLFTDHLSTANPGHVRGTGLPRAAPRTAGPRGDAGPPRQALPQVDDTRLPATDSRSSGGQ